VTAQSAPTPSSAAPATTARVRTPATSPAPSGLLRTPLYQEHLAAGAKLIEFAGFEMPAYYAGSSRPVNDEHMAVRTACGVFDVSHMGQIEVTGRGAVSLLQHVLSNDLQLMAQTTTEEGRAQYSVMCAPDGGVLEDLIAYRLGPERFLLVTNAANHARDVEWIGAHSEGFDAEINDRAAAYAMLAVQGPEARGLLAELAEMELPGRMRTRTGRIAGAAVLACGSGYTGEDGLELLCDPLEVTGLWRALRDRGAQPAGLAARDTLRLEACLPLYGNELTPARSPIEAGLAWCCHEETGFIGAEAVLEKRERGRLERLVAFRLTGAGIARRGNRVNGGGEVTSGTLSPCLGVGIGLAYVPAEHAERGAELEIDVRGKSRSAVVCEMPFVAKRSAG
jgi:aminomethyltransferase